MRLRTRLLCEEPLAPGRTHEINRCSSQNWPTFTPPYWTNFAPPLTGGKSAAIAYTLIETAKMNKVNPEAWLAWVLERIQDHPANRIAELLPWAYQDMIDAAQRNAEAENAA